VLEMNLVIHPSAEEDLLLTEQIHQRVLVRHKYNRQKGDVFPGV
jgi:hypothetical protein